MNSAEIFKEIEELYLNDKRPWIIGFSGGKDSTCVTQMVYHMLKNLPPEKRIKEVHILSSDTLVENPIGQSRRKKICEKIEKHAKNDSLPIKVKILRPELNDSFWVNLIGRGYPSPNRWFRWCTDRLKIRPMNKYVLEQVKENGEVIILLGVRKSESATRSQTMAKHEIKNFRLGKHASIPGAYIYAPIENWKENEVWEYLLSTPSPWGENNEDLAKFYRKNDREIQFIIDKSSPPGGSSRFGCWVCTVVVNDRALEGFIEEGKIWLKPLLEFRNWLKKIRDIPSFREKVRRSDKKKKIIADVLGREFNPPINNGHKTLGPFTFETRHEILRRLIKLQGEVASKSISLISPEEIKAIEAIWIYEGDNITSIAEVLEISKQNLNGELPNSRDYTKKLEEICEKYGISAQLIEQLLIVEKDLSSISRRTSIFARLEKVIEEHAMNKISKKIGEK